MDIETSKIADLFIKKLKHEAEKQAEVLCGKNSLSRFKSALKNPYFSTQERIYHGLEFLRRKTNSVLNSARNGISLTLPESDKFPLQLTAQQAQTYQQIHQKIIQTPNSQNSLNLETRTLAQQVANNLKAISKLYDQQNYHTLRLRADSLWRTLNLRLKPKKHIPDSTLKDLEQALDTASRLTWTTVQEAVRNNPYETDEIYRFSRENYQLISETREEIKNKKNQNSIFKRFASYFTNLIKKSSVAAQTRAYATP